MKLRVNPERWDLLGFPSQEAFREWLSPTTKSVGQSTSPLEIALLKRLLELGRGSVPKLEEEGFPKPVIVEAFNRLLRDKWARVEGKSIELSKVGTELLAEKLKGL